ncbi:MAG: S8 family serine peptidase [Bradyrhizobium sp.]|nr:S8 family serine peptidase [Bradyrhizobium sp.]
MRGAALAIALSMALALAPIASLRAGAPAPISPDREILVMVRQGPDHFRPTGEYGGTYGDQIGQSARKRIASQIAKRYGLTLADNWPMPMIGVDCFVMVVPDGRSTGAAADQVSHDAAVVWAQPVELYGVKAAAATHKDPLYPAEPAAKLWHLADLHRIATGRGVKVAIIDSGIEGTHPDLSGQLLVNRNFVAGQPLAVEEHGTGVAGIIAAKADNGIGIAGVAPGARLLGLRACWQKGSAGRATACDSLSVAKAIYFAIENRADVINLSLAGSDDRLVGELLKVALGKGSTVVAAFDQSRADGGFPASLPGVIAVSDSGLAPSQRLPYTAPGRDIPTTEPGGRWFIVNGSSYAAAHVSGLIALVRERRRSAPPSLVSARPGGGTIDACATLIRAAGGCDCNCGPFRLADIPARRQGE